MRRMLTDGDIKEVINEHIIGSDTISVDVSEDGNNLQIALDPTNLFLTFDFKNVELPDPDDYPSAVTVPGIYNVFHNAGRKLIYCSNIKVKVGGYWNDQFTSIDENGQFYIGNLAYEFNSADQVYPTTL